MMREALEARERDLEGSRELMAIHWEIVENASDGSNKCPSLVTSDGSGEEGRGKICRAKEKGREEEKEEESHPSRTKRAKEKEAEKRKQTVMELVELARKSMVESYWEEAVREQKEIKRSKKEEKEREEKRKCCE